ncbi:energy transducer TonB [uncultured Dechloromonas sp.]|uniref:energy transducer TonB n=1 Tax=uncultured Dechloromonas sp. TaxID=171719 RepID=UPI0025E06923|nr:energy transducer TonB [uncultured Dechloromonas sp.]
MNALEKRRFRIILGCSALLHGALFALLSVQRTPSATPVIQASIRLVDVAAAGSPAAPAATMPSATRPVAPRIEPQAAPRPGRMAQPARAPVAAPAAAAAQPDPLPVPAVAAVAGTAVAEAPRPTVAAAAPATAAPAQSDVLAGYRQRLTELFARGYEYPRIAAMRGWEGEVRLRLKVARRGNLLGVHLDRSSGFEVLDQHALALLEGHGNLPPLPEGLEGSEILVIVPINYKLRKTT